MDTHPTPDGAEEVLAAALFGKRLEDSQSPAYWIAIARRAIERLKEHGFVVVTQASLDEHRW